MIIKNIVYILQQMALMVNLLQQGKLFFKELADISFDIIFDGEIVGGEFIPEDRLEVKCSNKKIIF